MLGLVHHERVRLNLAPGASAWVKFACRQRWRSLAEVQERVTQDAALVTCPLCIEAMAAGVEEVLSG